MADGRSDRRRHKMKLRSTKPEPVYWLSLPAEIRLMILDFFTRQKSPGWASYAAVCKEWQFFIEKRNFHRLKLQGSCLDEFNRIVIRQRYLVHHIRLDIRLPKYSCRSCENTETLLWESRKCSIIRDTIWTLFSILSTWDPASDLTLELKAYSPSDSEHWFKTIVLPLMTTVPESQVQRKMVIPAKLAPSGTTQSMAGLMASGLRPLHGWPYSGCFN